VTAAGTIAPTAPESEACDLDGRYALHEAAHVAVALVLGARVTSASIRPPGRAGGYAIIPRHLPDALEEATVDIAGDVAVDLCTSRGNDIAYSFEEAGGDRRSIDKCSRRLRCDPIKLIREASCEARRILYRQADAVLRIRAALIAQRTLNEAEILRLFHGWAKPDARKHHRRCRRVIVHCEVIPCGDGRVGVIATRPGKARKRRRRPEGAAVTDGRAKCILDMEAHTEIRQWH